MILYTPQNQQRLTNVAIVRLKKNGTRFEIACYKNKLQDYRNDPSTPLSEVLQSDQVFSNVTKGQLSNAKDLCRAFGTDDRLEIIKEILQKGEGQVGAAERSHLLESLRKDIAVIVAEKTVNPETGRPYTPSMIERVLSHQIHFSFRIEDSAKQQALEVIKVLEQTQDFPIVRR